MKIRSFRKLLIIMIADIASVMMLLTATEK